MEIKLSKFNKVTLKALLKFLIPSFIGILLFMTPMVFNGEVTIPVAMLSKLISKVLGDYLPFIMTFIISLAFTLTLITKIFKPKFIINSKYLNNLFNISKVWFLSRTLGFIFVISTYFKIGPEAIWSENTGGLLLTSLLPVLFGVFLFAGLLLPLILDFGLLEFFGSLLTKVMRPIFKLPGRSSIDCITSWLGDGTIGVLLTSKQYEDGFYSKREAAVIATNFSAVSITFALVVIAQVNLSHMFVPFYLTVSFAGVVAAIIIPRIPPLSKINDSYYNNSNNNLNEIIPEGYTSFSFGLEKAIEKANSPENTINRVSLDGFKNIFDMWIGVTPVIMSMGTLALIIAEYTSFFEWLGLPFIPLLKLLQIPEAAAASKTIMVGFADMFLPSVIASSIASDMTRFIIAALSVTQLIYMSEVGGLILGSKIPLNVKDLLFIFIIRTLITLPIITLIAHIIF